MKVLLIVGLMGASVGTLSADILVGAPANNGNSFPFGSVAPGQAGTLFQETYASSDFSGPVTIGGVGFFDTIITGGSYRAGTYTLDLSTTNTPVGTLNPVQGADEELFTSVYLSGAVPPGEVLFSGTPFSYNPDVGNLLLTIQYSGSGVNGYADFDVDQFAGSPSSGPFSESYNFGGDVSNQGLVTDFEPYVTPEPSGALGLILTLCVLARRFAPSPLLRK